MRLVVLFATLALAASAQEWELGGGAGYGFYRKASVIAPAGTVDAGIRSRFALTGWVTQHKYDYISGEIRYVYQDGDPFIQSAGGKTNVQGQSHALHYDVLFHLRHSETPRRIRPYFAAGLGIKRYVVTGPANPAAPFTDIAQLNSTGENKLLLSLGGGIAIRAARHVLIRVDFRDYITTFPKRIISPVPLATARGLYNQFTPMVGISYGF